MLHGTGAVRRINSPPKMSHAVSRNSTNFEKFKEIAEYLKIYNFV